jgi:hypothetical protein
MNMKPHIILILAGAATLGTPLIVRSLLAQATQTPERAIPQGFSNEYVLIETSNKTFTVLRRPRLRTLGDRTYLVGKTVSVSEVTQDELFSPTIQWVCLKDICRMGEVENESGLREIAAIGVEKRDRDAKQAQAEQASRDH